MDQVINATFAPGDVKAVESKSFWSACKGIVVDLSHESVVFAKKMTIEVAGPAISKATVITLDTTDRMIKTVMVNGMKVVKGRPYIAMAMSPSTILKMAAIKAYEQEFGAKTTDTVNAAVTTQQ